MRDAYIFGKYLTSPSNSTRTFLYAHTAYKAQYLLDSMPSDFMTCECNDEIISAVTEVSGYTSTFIERLHSVNEKAGGHFT